MKVIYAKIRRNNNVGGYELWDEELLGTFIPGTEFIFEDFVNSEVRIEIKDVKEKEEGWKLIQKDGKYKMQTLEKESMSRRFKIESCGMKHDYDLLGTCNKCGHKRGEE